MSEGVDWPTLIEAQLQRALANSGAQTIPAGAFRVHLWHRPDPFYRNVAVPVRRPADWAPAIRLMDEVFRAAGRPARLELIEERWPDLARALADVGFVCRQRLPVMVQDRPSATTVAASTVHLLTPESPPGLVAATLDALNAAFGHAMTDATRAAEAAQLAREIESGHCRVAVVLEDGLPVAGACLVGCGAAAELAGVWTALSHRRRGLGTAVCQAVLNGFLAAGGRFAWLGAHGNAAEALYARLGFRRVGHQVDFSRPDA